jgi:ADP-ribosyl-[dinitrogen reductase] hydrolase
MSDITEFNLLQDRFRGVLIGLAVGDALGGPLEFQPASPTGSYVTEMVGGGWQQLDPGEWTDDTAMSLCVTESLLVKRVFDPDDIASRFVGWLKSQPKDIGVHTNRVLQSIAAGETWETASLQTHEMQPDDAGNGSLMRCAPLSLFFFRHPEFLSELSPILSRITHAHPDCEQACVFVNVLISALLHGVRTVDAIESAYEAIPSASPELTERIGRAMGPECLAQPTGWVLDTLEVSLWHFLHTETFEDAIVNSINMGGDADTIGAITGAIAGARYGYAGIPGRWIAALRAAQPIKEYADRLLDLAYVS